MRHLYTLMMILGLLTAVAAPSRAGDADLRLSLVLLPEARLLVQEEASAAEGQAAASIQIGDPVSIRLRLWNAGEAASEPTARVSSSIAPMRIVVTRPDGSSVDAQWHWRLGTCDTTWWRHPAAVEPGDEQVFETFLFANATEPREAGPLQYLFQDPGRYQLHAEYYAGDPAVYFAYRYEQRGDPPRMLRSQPVTVEVVGPPIPGWQRLQAAGITYYVGGREWPALADPAAGIDAVVDAAGRPWLTQWRDRLRGMPPSRADLRLSLSILPEPRLVIGGASAAEGALTGAARIGDPVSIRARLWNAGDGVSDPTVRLSLHSTPMMIWVKRPDGSTVEAIWEPRCGVVHAVACPQPMAPREQHVVETYLFEHRVERRAGPTWEYQYLFEEPGRYEIRAEYWVGDAAEHSRFRTGHRPDCPPVLLSDPVILNVVCPPIPGWAELKTAGILSYAGHCDWPALADPASPVNALIDAADRPWLTEWRKRLLARAPADDGRGTPDSR